MKNETNYRMRRIGQRYESLVACSKVSSCVQKDYNKLFLPTRIAREWEGGDTYTHTHIHTHTPAQYDDKF